MIDRTRQPDRGPEIARTPWWRVGTVWLVIGGPMAVVIASVATAVIAWQGVDDVLPSTRPGGASAQGIEEVPAIQARNHAATAGR